MRVLLCLIQPSMYNALELLVQHKCSLFHELDIIWCAVDMLSILNWILKRIFELGSCAKIVLQVKRRHRKIRKKK